MEDRPRRFRLVPALLPLGAALLGVAVSMLYVTNRYDPERGLNRPGSILVLDLGRPDRLTSGGRYRACHGAG